MKGLFFTAFLSINVLVNVSGQTQDSYSKKVIEETYSIGNGASDSLLEKRIKYYDANDSIRLVEVYREGEKLDEKLEYFYCKKNAAKGESSLCPIGLNAIQGYEIEGHFFSIKGIMYTSAYASYLQSVNTYDVQNRLVANYHFNSKGHLVTKTMREWSANTVTLHLYETSPDGELILVE